MKVVCPKCREEIASAQVNVGSDVAYCERCQEAYALSTLVASTDTDDTPLSEPPKGCWFETGINQWRVGATTRSYAALFLIPFMGVWSGFSLGGIYGTQIINGKFNIFLSLFGIPFLLGTLLMGSIAVMSVCGKVEIRVRDDDAETFAGVGPFGWRRKFAWSKIQFIREAAPKRQYSGQQSQGLELEGDERLIHFGTMVTEERLRFIKRLLRRMLTPA